MRVTLEQPVLLNELIKPLLANTHGQYNDVMVSGVCTDTRELVAGDIFFALHGPSFDGHKFVDEAINKGAVAVVTQQASNSLVPVLQVDDTLVALGALAKWWRSRFSAKVIAITGSCGKTTVKEMLSAILAVDAPVLATEKNYNNEIGVPMTLLKLNQSHQYAVIEMGASKQGDIAYLSNIAGQDVGMVNNIAPAHLEGFGSIEGVAKAKSEIYQRLESGVAVINRDEPYSKAWEGFPFLRKKLTYGLYCSSDVTARDIHYVDDNETRYVLSSPLGKCAITLPFTGEHNVQNSLAAITLAISVGVSLDDIQHGLANAAGVAGRLNFITAPWGGVIIDDTYNANLASVTAALKVLVRRNGEKVLVLGDLAECGEESESIHRLIGKKAYQLGIDKVFTVGTWCHYTSAEFGKQAEHFESLDELLVRLEQELSSNLTILVKGSRLAGMEQVVAALTSSEGVKDVVMVE